MPETPLSRTAVTASDVERALDGVCDPCSLAAGVPRSIMDLGLLTGWSYTDGTLRVSITATGPGCTFLGKIADAARDALRGLDGVRDVRVELDTDTIWRPDRMRRAPREALARRRAAAADAAMASGVVPYALRGAR